VLLVPVVRVLYILIDVSLMGSGSRGHGMTLLVFAKACIKFSEVCRRLANNVRLKIIETT